MIGTTLSHFRVTAKLGEGGMGEVYRAEDTKLGREVAIKVLPESFTENPERLARFEREAQVLASLSHTNVAGIYQVEEVDGRHFLVMELAEGETLAERIARGPIPLDEAISLALQIAEGLEAAHLRGIVHRDLKPANIKVTPDRQIKILDFGLARAMTQESGLSGSAPDMSQSPTLAAHMTGAGVILGTAAYMAPEQARGETVDARADVWAFGVVLMEMLTGKSVWASSTVSDTLAAVLARDPSWDDLDPSTPRPVRRLLERCLEKDARSRLQAVGEARIALLRYQEDPTREGAATVDTAPATPLWRRALPWAIAAASLLATVSVWTRPEPASAPTPVRRYVAAQASWGGQVSPDGNRIYYRNDDRLMIHKLDELTPTTSEDLRGAEDPFWSADGSEIGFVKDHKLWSVDVTTLRTRVIAELDDDFSIITGAWSPSGEIYLARWRGGIFTVPASGGELREYVPADEALVDFHELFVLPGGDALLANPHLTSDSQGVEIIRDGKRQRVHEFSEDFDVISMNYLETGFILFTRGDRNRGIWALPFSLDEERATGEPFLVARDAVFPAIGDGGVMSHVASLSPQQTQLVLLDRQGEVVETLGEQLEGLSDPQLSPDGQQVVYLRRDRGPTALWIYDRRRALERRLTSSEHYDRSPVWTPDGKRIAFHRDEGSWEEDKNRVWIMSADGTGQARALAPSMGGATFTPDSETMIYTGWDVRLKEDLLRIGLQGSSRPEPVLVNDARLSSPRLSPNGELLAYVSHESGEGQVYLTSFPDVEIVLQVSRDGGAMPRWSGDSRRLFFAQSPSGGGTEDRVLEARVATGPELTVSRPEPVLIVRDGTFDLDRGYDVSPDGQSFLVVREFGEPVIDVVIVQNWMAAFPELAGSR